MHNATEEAVTARILSTGSVDRGDEEDSEDDEGKDPLQGDDFDGNLLDSQRCIESATRKHPTQNSEALQ